jgi:hypothetical protein
MSRPAGDTRTVIGPPAGEVEAAPGVSRRALMANAVLAGTAVVAAPVVGRAVRDVTTHEPLFTGRLDEPLVARVRDPRTGVIDIFFGEEHIVLHDRLVASRLARAVQ